jgi:hypothetical protein
MPNRQNGLIIRRMLALYSGQLKMVGIHGLAEKPFPAEKRYGAENVSMDINSSEFRGEYTY